MRDLWGRLLDRRWEVRLRTGIVVLKANAGILARPSFLKHPRVFEVVFVFLSLSLVGRLFLAIPAPPASKPDAPSCALHQPASRAKSQPTMKDTCVITCSKRESSAEETLKGVKKYSSTTATATAAPLVPRRRDKG